MSYVLFVQPGIRLQQLRETYERLTREAEAARKAFHLEVYELYTSGVSARELAEILGITRQRVHQIIEALTTLTAGDLEERIDVLLEGLSHADYRKFSRDFNARMREFLNKERFAQMRRELVRTLGNYTSRERAEVQRRGGNLVLTTTAAFQHETVSVRVVFEDSPNHSITGLWFDSPRLNSSKEVSRGGSR